MYTRSSHILKYFSIESKDIYLCFKFVALRELSLHLPIHVLLKLLHVEQFEGFVHLQQSVGQLENVVTDRRLLGRVLHVDVGLAHPLDQDVAAVVHLEFAARTNLGLELGHFMIAHRILKSVDSNPETIKPVLRPTHGQHWRPGVGLGNPPVPLQHDHFGPNFIIDIVPFIQHLRNVILKWQTVGQIYIEIWSSREPTGIINKYLILLSRATAYRFDGGNGINSQ